MRQRRSISHYVIIIALIFAAILCVYPMWYTLITSFSDNASVTAGKVLLVPRGFNLGSYKALMRDNLFFSSFTVSVIRTTVGSALNMTLMILTAYPLCLPRSRFKAGRYYTWFFVVNMLFSGGLIPTYILISKYGLIDSIWSLILPGALPIYNMILLINFFRVVPYSLNEAARIDGASPIQILIRIYVPVSKAALATLLLFSAVTHWNSYFDGLIYINDQRKQPLQTYVYQISALLDPKTMTSEQLREASKLSDLTLNSAKVIIALVPILAIYPFLQRYFVVGMTLGSVKE